MAFDVSTADKALLASGIIKSLSATKANLRLVESPRVASEGAGAKAYLPVATAHCFVCCGREWTREQNEFCPFCHMRAKAYKTPEQKLAEWREKAEDPRNVCVERDGELSIAQVGPEPIHYRDWLIQARAKLLGCGGKGFVLVDLFGEGAITHYLWTVEAVPEKYAHLFRVTHLRVEKLTDAQERAHWDRFEPWADQTRSAA